MRETAHLTLASPAGSNDFSEIMPPADFGRTRLEPTELVDISLDSVGEGYCQPQKKDTPEGSSRALVPGFLAAIRAVVPSSLHDAHEVTSPVVILRPQRQLDLRLVEHCTELEGLDFGRMRRLLTNGRLMLLGGVDMMRTGAPDVVVELPDAADSGTENLVVGLGLEPATDSSGPKLRAKALDKPLTSFPSSGWISVNRQNLTVFGVEALSDRWPANGKRLYVDALDPSEVQPRDNQMIRDFDRYLERSFGDKLPAVGSGAREIIRPSLTSPIHIPVLSNMGGMDLGGPGVAQ